MMTRHHFPTGALAAALCATLPLCAANAQDTISHQPTAHYADRVELFAAEPPITADDIVMLGNSLTENGGDWGTRLGAANVVNRGIVGDDADGMLRRLVQITPGHPRAIFLMAGINDLSHGLTAEAVADKVCSLIDSIGAASPSTRLYVQSLLPIDEGTGRWKLLEGRSADVAAVNALLEKACQRRGLTFINLYPKFVRLGTNTLRRELSRDGLHLSDQGYKLWAFELRRYVNEANAE